MSTLSVPASSTDLPDPPLLLRVADQAAYPVLRHFDTIASLGTPPRAAARLVEAAAVRLLDSEMVIALHAATPDVLPDSSASTPLQHDEAPLTEALLEQISREGFHHLFKPFMRAFIRIMFGLFFSDDQNRRACDCIDSGHNFAFLMSDGGGPTLAAWRTVVRSDDNGLALTVDKVWGIEAHRDCMAVVAARLPGVMFPAAYLVWPDEYRKLKRTTCGAPFLAGNLQLANVGGQVRAHAEDRLRIGGPTVFNKYLTVVRPYFVRALMAHVGWLAQTGRIEFDADARAVHQFIADAARSQTDDAHYSFGKVQRVLAIKLLSNEFLTALVRDGRVATFDDQRDLLAFSKMEGSSYRCYHELRKSLRCEAGS
ncbi:hypothetical protein BLA23254_04883 [Burkholderia lata]|uniref:Uncharacterized protein n=1 Tax=Burkholderia lata (strain ATCC 17760 / DSM 23089 / LMG 22485 / NCIMB 9086 / R18194 / 383) TaxID=482957 RepID=A0A6P2P5A3_BURL3|nr:hypothetical protein [Burkholderia lata]VWC02560.1 hypothetical protein BLA23254_04883 [Burkholderia lata]